MRKSYSGKKKMSLSSEELLAWLAEFRKQKRENRKANDANYPRFYAERGNLTAILGLGKTEVVKIFPATNSGYGFDFRIYKTRRMVLKLGDNLTGQINESEFFEQFLKMILSYFSVSKEFEYLINKQRLGKQQNTKLMDERNTKLLGE